MGVNEGDEEAIRKCFKKAIESVIYLTQNKALKFGGENFIIESVVVDRDDEAK
ncbi:MAG: hypothetical protein IJK18_04980 [Clostridia bacterium]|nr:hypothetical protein [Clostridia bacterium]